MKKDVRKNVIFMHSKMLLLIKYDQVRQNDQQTHGYCSINAYPNRKQIWKRIWKEISQELLNKEVVLFDIDRLEKPYRKIFHQLQGICIRGDYDSICLNKDAEYTSYRYFKAGNNDIEVSCFEEFNVIHILNALYRSFGKPGKRWINNKQFNIINFTKLQSLIQEDINLASILPMKK